MKDVLFYQNYSSVADVSTIAICVICAFLLHSTYAKKQKNLTIFRIGMALVVIGAASSIVFHNMVEELEADEVVASYILRDISYISLVLTYVMFCIYIRNIIGISGRAKKKFNSFIWTVFVIFTIIEVSSPFTGVGFYVDSELNIHQNFYRDIFRYAYVLYTAFMAVTLIVYRRKFIVKMLNCIVNVMVVSFVIMALESYLQNTSYTCMSFTFPFMVVLFLFHYNSYDTEMGTLDFRAFDPYIRDIDGKSYSMIFLYMQNMDAEKIKAVSEDFFRFNERLFRDCCTFRLSDSKLVIVYRDSRNKKAQEKTAILIKDVEQISEERHTDYRIVLVHSDEAIRTSREYMLLDEFLEAKLPLNSFYECCRSDIDAYLKSAYILKELADINVKQDLNDRRVKVYCQPVLNTSSDSFSSAEALMRLELPECGIVYPDQFIPLAEKHEYIHTLSLIILNKTCRQIKELEIKGFYIERISVNFSILELRNRNFCNDVTRIIRNSGIEFGKVAIELTESRNENDFENVKRVMYDLQGLGVKFYLDDFGTGYSNFERIIGLPIDIIKFDRSLTILAGKDEESRFMVGSFSDIFKKSNYQILFEGVEDESDEEQCKAMNALYLQGYKYSKPIPIEQLAGFLSRSSAAAL